MALLPATPSPTAPAAAAIVAAVAVKSAWRVGPGTRATFRQHAAAILLGPARTGLALGVVLVGAVGLPGMAAFDARATLIRLAFPGTLGVAVLVAAFAPVVYLGRMLVSGLDAMSEPVRSATHAIPRVRGGRADGWADDPSLVRYVPAAIGTNRHPIAAVAAILVALVGLSVALNGLGSTTVGGPSAGGSPSPGPTVGIEP